MYVYVIDLNDRNTEGCEIIERASLPHTFRNLLTDNIYFNRQLPIGEVIVLCNSLSFNKAALKQICTLIKVA